MELKQIQMRLMKCPPPRKSLVKGERFIRSEGRPECCLHNTGMQSNTASVYNACGYQVDRSNINVPDII